MNEQKQDQAPAAILAAFPILDFAERVHRSGKPYAAMVRAKDGRMRQVDGVVDQTVGFVTVGIKGTSAIVELRIVLRSIPKTPATEAQQVFSVSWPTTARRSVDSAGNQIGRTYYDPVIRFSNLAERDTVSTQAIALWRRWRKDQIAKGAGAAALSGVAVAVEADDQIGE